jgi:hypothetical protein
VQKTGFVNRFATIYNATSVSFETYGTYTYYSNIIGSTLSVLKRDYGVNMTSITGTLVGGGAGGESVGGATGTAGNAGGGGGGDVETFSGLTGAAITVSRGAGGASGQYGGFTAASIDSAVYYGHFGTPGAGGQGGATYLGFYNGIDNYNYGALPPFPGGGGGGGGAGGAAFTGDGGPALSGYGPGGPGYFNFGEGYTGVGQWGSGGTSTSYGAGGAGGSTGTSGQNGYFAVSYVGPYRLGGALGDA